MQDTVSADMSTSPVSAFENQRRPTLVDLFSGCGGMSLGFRQAGFEILLAIDNDRMANEQYGRNLGLEPRELNLFDANASDILEMASVSKGNLDVLVGCPPCQGFTQLRSRQKRYKTNNLVIKMAQLAAEIAPRVIVLENVKGILTIGEREFRNYKAILADSGYHTIHGVLEAADYGVPQFRKRVIAISVRNCPRGPIDMLPKPSHCAPGSDKTSKLRPWRTVRDAIGKLPPVESGGKHPAIKNHEASNHSGRVLEMIRNVPRNGGNRRDLPQHLWLDCHSRIESGAENMYGRMKWDEPSLTMSSRCTTPACGRFIHPEQDRGITIREALALQSFPSYYNLASPPSVSCRLVGNAMPVRFAKRIALHTRALLRFTEQKKETH